MKYALTTLTLALALIGPVESVHAKERNRVTRMTINQPFTIPGQIALPAGSYVLRLANHSTTPLVQVMDKDQARVLASVFATPVRTTETFERHQFVFAEAPASAPLALKGWFEPGSNHGLEFVGVDAAIQTAILNEKAGEKETGAAEN